MIQPKPFQPTTNSGLQQPWRSSANVGFSSPSILKVARRLVDRSTFGGDKPEPISYSLRQEGKSRPKNFSMGRDDPTRSYAVLTSNDERAPGDPRGQSLINCRDGATHDGYYDFTFEVESQGRGNLTKVFSAQRRNDYPVYRPEDLHC